MYFDKTTVQKIQESWIVDTKLYTLIRCLQMSKRLLDLWGKLFLNQHFSPDISSQFCLFDHHHLCQTLRRPSPDPPCPRLQESGAHSSGWWSPSCRVFHQNQDQPQLSRYLSVKKKNFVTVCYLKVKDTYPYEFLIWVATKTPQNISKDLWFYETIWVLDKLKCIHQFSSDLIIPICTWFSW